jgi:hypothetical protein
MKNNKTSRHTGEIQTLYGAIIFAQSFIISKNEDDLQREACNLRNILNVTA